MTNIGATATRRNDWWPSLVLHSEPVIEYGDRYTLFAEEGNFVLDLDGCVYRDACPPLHDRRGCLKRTLRRQPILDRFGECAASTPSNLSQAIIGEG